MNSTMRALLIGAMMGSACGGMVAVDGTGASGSGRGGAGTTTSTATATATSSSKGSGMGGASSGVTSSPSSGTGGDKDSGSEGGGCARCAAALETPDPIPVIAAFCKDGGIGSPISRWDAYVDCGCAMGGTCALSCADSAWCKGLFPVPTVYTPPVGTCAACLDDPSFDGCGSQLSACEKDK